MAGGSSSPPLYFTCWQKQSRWARYRCLIRAAYRPSLVGPRVLLLLATLHLGYQNYGWSLYGLVHMEWSTDSCPSTGIAAYATLRLACNNTRPGHATLTAFEGGVTKIRLPNPQVRIWRPGAHAFLKVPRLGLIQSHPATIASRPSSHSNDLGFILKGHKGFTDRLLKSATSPANTFLPKTEQDATAFQQICLPLIDGPYGGSHADFAAFDTVLPLLGSAGVTFTLPQLLDIAHRASTRRLPVRRLEFIWVVKNTSWTSCIADELSSAHAQLQASGIDVEIKIFATCNEIFTGSSNTTTTKKTQA